MNETLTTEINETFDDLLKTFAQFKDGQIDVVPFKDNWTAGQVAEHIEKSLGNITAFLNKQAEPTTDRPFDANVAQIRKLFLDFSTRLQSPDFILPLESKHDKAALLAAFETFKTQLLDAVATLDLSLTCKSFGLPAMGFLTRMEWINFFIVHTKRHTHQLKNICTALKEKDA